MRLRYVTFSIEYSIHKHDLNKVSWPSEPTIRHPFNEPVYTTQATRLHGVSVIWGLERRVKAATATNCLFVRRDTTRRRHDTRRTNFGNLAARLIRREFLFACLTDFENKGLETKKLQLRSSIVALWVQITNNISYIY